MKLGCKKVGRESHGSVQISCAARENPPDQGSYATQVEKAVNLLKGRIEGGDKQALFLLGLLYYEEGRYAEAEGVFDSLKELDPRALFQLAIMSYDGLGSNPDEARGVDYMHRVCKWQGPEADSIRQLGLYNLGRAYLEGYGVPLSNTEAERLWLQAADEGSAGGGACVSAQSSLALFYCRPESLDLHKAFLWHSEACGKGSLESQGALGIMFLYGWGVRQDPAAGVQCLKEASDRGNVYAQAHLAAYYYHSKLYTCAAALAKRISSYQNIPAIATVTECLPEYVTKGVAIALFYYARCLQLGLGVAKDTQQANLHYIKAAQLDPEVCKDLQMDVTFGRM